MRNEFEYSYRVLKFDLSAGLSDIEVPIHAERVDYVSPTDGPELQIRLQAKSNDQLPLRPNGSIEAPFTRLYISASAVARTVFLMVGAPAGVKVTGRDVTVSGSILARTNFEDAVNKGLAFSAGRIATGGAAVFTKTQILNPSNSGRRIILHALELFASAISDIDFVFRPSASAFANVICGVGSWSSQVDGTLGGVGSLQFEASAGFNIGTQILKSTLPATQRVIFFDKLQRGIVILPGTAFGWVLLTANVTLTCSPFISEEII